MGLIKKGPSLKECLVGVLALSIVGIFIVQVYIFTLPAPEAAKVKPTPTVQPAQASANGETSRLKKAMAYNFAKDCISTVLKAPSTAEYESYNPKRVFIVGDGHDIVVLINVDAENSYGAKIRTRMRVKLRVDDCDNFTCTDVSVVQ